MVYLLPDGVEFDFTLINFYGLVCASLQIHRDPETGKVLNLTFAWADEGSELKVDVPLVFKGENVCPCIKKGSLFVSLVLPFVTSVIVNGSVSVLLVVMLVVCAPPPLFHNFVSSPYILT